MPPLMRIWLQASGRSRNSPIATPAQAADARQAYDDYASGSNSVPGTGFGGAPGTGFGGGLGSVGSSEFDLTPRSLDEEAPF